MRQLKKPLLTLEELKFIFYKIQNNNYTIQEIQISLINIFKAFIDVFYEMDNDVNLKKIKPTIMDLPYWNGKNIKDIFGKNRKSSVHPVEELYHNNQNYVMIMSSINETYARRYMRSVVSHVKINNSVIRRRRRKPPTILYAHSLTKSKKSKKSKKSNTRKLKSI